MNPDHHTVSNDTDMLEPSTAGEYQQPVEPVAPPNPLLVLHRLLRHRYPYAIIFAIMGAVGCGLAGYYLVKPTYRSVGMVRYKPVLPRILYESEESSVMPMFDSYVESQAQLMGSQRVLDLAMQDEVWKSRGIVFTVEKQALFRDNLEINKGKRSSIVSVLFTDPDPDMAQASVKTVINAYTRIYGEHDNISEADRLQILEERRASLTNQLASIRSRILGIANEFGSDALDQMYQYKLEQLNELERAMVKVGMDLARVGASDTGSPSIDDSQSEDSQVVPSVKEIAEHDGHMRQLIEDQKIIEQELALKRVRLGDNHRTVVELQARLSLQDQVIEEYASTYEGLSYVSGANEGPNRNINIHELHERARNLQTLYDQDKAELLDLGRKKLQIDSLKVEEQTVQQRLKETKFRIEQINVESGFGGRIDVLSTGDRPLTPHKDKRIQLAVGGVGAGVLLGVGPVVLWGLLDRRLHSFSDARHSAAHIRILGLLPNLPVDLSDEDHATVAGYCIHHMRTLLQLDSGNAHHQVIAITSPSAQAGKTSLTLALGLSYAVSGSKTLLIDCDLAGGGLTDRLETKICRQLGEILTRQGVVTREQVEAALKNASALGQRLGETMVGSGFLSDEDLSRALASQGGQSVGLLDAIAGDEIGACIAKTDIPGLDVLPVGRAMAHDMCRISPAALRRVVDAARSKYEMVLIDTGPIPGSAEASIASAVADRVIVVVTRGDQKTQVQNALESLDRIGVHVAGIVFNRANARDIAQSMMSSSYGSSTSHNGDKKNGDGAKPTILLNSKRFGPVEQAVGRTAQFECSNVN